MKHTIETTKVERTGTLHVVHELDLDGLHKKHGAEIPYAALVEGGLYVVEFTDTHGKVRRLHSFSKEKEAFAFVNGFAACAKARSRKTQKKKSQVIS